jgi:hypothetical protein
MKVHFICFEITSTNTSVDKDLLTVMQAVEWSLTVWGALSNATFKNCWRHAGILPESWKLLLWPEDTSEVGESDSVDEQRVDDSDDAVDEQLAALLDQLPMEEADRLPVDEFISLPGEQETEGVRSLEDVLDARNQQVPAAADDEEPDPDELRPPLVTLPQAQQMSADLLQFMWDQPGYFSECSMQEMMYIVARISSMPVANTNLTRQITIHAAYGIEVERRARR